MPVPVGPAVTVEFGSVYGGVAKVPIAEDLLTPPETVDDGAVPVSEIVLRLEPFEYGAKVETDDRLGLAEIVEYVGRPPVLVGEEKDRD